MNKRADKLVQILTWAIVGSALALSSLIIAMGIVGPSMLLLHASITT